MDRYPQLIKYSFSLSNIPAALGGSYVNEFYSRFLQTRRAQFMLLIGIRILLNFVSFTDVSFSIVYLIARAAITCIVD